MLNSYWCPVKPSKQRLIHVRQYHTYWSIWCFSYRETPAGSNRSSPTATEDVASSSHSIVQGDLWGTGNTTERSSVDSQYSWDVSDYKPISLLVEHWLSIWKVTGLISVFGGYILGGRKCPSAFYFDFYFFILILMCQVGLCISVNKGSHDPYLLNSRGCLAQVLHSVHTSSTSNDKKNKMIMQEEEKNCKIFKVRG